VVTGTARISRIEPTSIAITCSATASRLIVSANSVPGDPEDEEDWQRGAGVGSTQTR
jgi:hypothetical protein